MARINYRTPNIDKLAAGGILDDVHIALRCMVHTAMVFRNLKGYTVRLPFTEMK